MSIMYVCEQTMGGFCSPWQSTRELLFFVIYRTDPNPKEPYNDEQTPNHMHSQWKPFALRFVLQDRRLPIWRCKERHGRGVARSNRTGD